RLIHGLATAMFTPLALAMVGEWFAQQRGEAFGWYTSATQGGGLLGPMIGGAIVYQYGFTPAFLLAGMFGMLAVCFFWLIPQEPSPVPVLDHSWATLWPELREGLQRVCQSPPILMTSLVEAAKMVGNGTLMAFLPLYGLLIGVNAAEIGVLFGVQAFTSFIAKPFMGATIRSEFAPTTHYWGTVLVCVDGDGDSTYSSPRAFTRRGRSLWIWRSLGDLFNHGIGR
ncbi:MAG: MFS transporter, partial [Nitrospirales bacterium]